MALKANIVEQPQPAAPAAQPQSAAPQAPAPAGLLAGIHVTEVTPGQDLPPLAHGVMVSAIDPNSPAAQTLQPNDVIEEVDRLAIHSVAEYQQAAGAVSGPRVLLSICRGQQRAFVVITGR